MPDDALRQALPYAKDDPGFRPATLAQINHPGDLGDLFVVASILGEFVHDITHDLAHLNPQLSMDDHIQRHTQVAQCYAKRWSGDDPDYQLMRWHQDGAGLAYWKTQVGITAKTPCEGAYCLLVRLLEQVYRITDQLASGQTTDRQAETAMTTAIDDTMRALVGLDFMETPR